MRRRPRVVLYTRAGCGLCVRAEQLVEAEARGSRVSVVDVDADAVLVERYGVRVPVVTVDDIEIGALEIGPGVIRRAVRAARRGSRRWPRRDWAS